MTQYYIGITIGPIVETLCMASRPASLWCASSMFSWLSEDICNGLIKEKGEIISPYYENGKSPDRYSVVAEKAGKYHDRIICSVEAESDEAVKKLVDDVISNSKKNLAKTLMEAFPEKGKKEALNEAIIQYLQVHYIIEKESESDKNCILRLSPYLDAAELCPVFQTEQTQHPIVELFEGKDDAHNAYLKKCFNIKNGHTSLLYDNEKKIRDIEHIANGNPDSDRKIFNYYAVVQADGDNMGKLLESLQSDDEVKEFSKTCLNYTTSAAKMIDEYGGVVIYAGGDDLLFIAPLENSNKSAKRQNLFQLCNNIADIFHNSFTEEKDAISEYVDEESALHSCNEGTNELYESDKENKNAPTLSFGISINYKHFPLYEAFSDALGLLGEAKKVPKIEVEKNPSNDAGATEDDKSVKKEEKPEKNKTAVHIRKSSGQSMKFRYTNKSAVYSQLINLLKPKVDSVVLNSMLYKIGLYRPILTAVLASEERNLKDAFDNLFDSEYHSTVSGYINNVCNALENLYAYVSDPNCKDKNYALEKVLFSVAEKNEEIALDLLYEFLRTARFFTEKRR